jgi:hypothetical protein
MRSGEQSYLAPEALWVSDGQGPARFECHHNHTALGRDLGTEIVPVCGLQGLGVPAAR